MNPKVQVTNQSKATINNSNQSKFTITEISSIIHLQYILFGLDRNSQWLDHKLTNKRIVWGGIIAQVSANRLLRKEDSLPLPLIEDAKTSISNNLSLSLTNTLGTYITLNNYSSIFGSAEAKWSILH